MLSANLRALPVSALLLTFIQTVLSYLKFELQIHEYFVVLHVLRDPLEYNEHKEITTGTKKNEISESIKITDSKLRKVRGSESLSFMSG